MNLEVEAYEGELKSLRELKAIVRHELLAEKFGDRYFICGESGTKDDNNMPDKIHVCPAYGLDFFYVYEYTGLTNGTEW